MSSASDAVGLFNGLGSIGRMTGMRSLCEESSTSFAFDVCTMHRSLRINRGFELCVLSVADSTGKFYRKCKREKITKVSYVLYKTEWKMIVKSGNGEVYLI